MSTQDLKSSQSCVEHKVLTQALFRIPRPLCYIILSAWVMHTRTHTHTRCVENVCTSRASHRVHVHPRLPNRVFFLSSVRCESRACRVASLARQRRLAPALCAQQLVRGLVSVCYDVCCLSYNQRHAAEKHVVGPMTLL